MKKEEEIRTIFAKNIKFYRKKLKLSQMELATKTGITTNFINDIENGKKWVSPGTLAKLCEVLEIEPYKLFLEVDFEEKSSNKIINQFCSELSNDILIMLNEISNKYK